MTTRTLRNVPSTHALWALTVGVIKHCTIDSGARAGWLNVHGPWALYAAHTVDTGFSSMVLMRRSDDGTVNMPWQHSGDDLFNAVGSLRDDWVIQYTGDVELTIEDLAPPQGTTLYQIAQMTKDPANIGLRLTAWRHDMGCYMAKVSVTYFGPDDASRPAGIELTLIIPTPNGGVIDRVLRMTQAELLGSAAVPTAGGPPRT